MGTIQNSDTQKEIQKVTRLQISQDGLPNQFNNQVVLTAEVNPRLVRTARVFNSGASLVNATSATLLTTPTDRDMYITGGHLSMIKDATSTATVMALAYTDDETGLVVPILRFRGLTLTANAQSMSISFSHPLKVKRGTNIVLTSDTNVANISMSGTVIGYVDDVSAA